MASPVLPVPKIKHFKGTGEERAYLLEKLKFTIGRSGENDLQTNDASVSRFHAEIIKEGNQFKLIDKQSKCGTFVNGERVQTHVLQHQDRILLGNDTQIVYLTHDDITRDSGPFRTGTPSMIQSVAGSDLKNVSHLLEVARLLSGTAPLHEILDMVLDAAIEITRAERGFLVLKDARGEPQVQRGRDKAKQSVAEESFQISTTVLKQVIESGEKVFLSDVQGPNKFALSESMLNLELRTIICLPLKQFGILDSSVNAHADQKVIGALYLDGKKATESFSKISQGILDSLATDATAVIENARLLRESREKERLELELATAQEIQATLLPRIKGSYGYFEAYAQNIPSRHISGDCYDLIKFPDGRYAAMIADVSGKGVSAAILCSMVQGLLFAEAMKHPSPADCLNSVNGYLVQRTAGNKFVTLFYATIAPSGEFQFVNAGHNPPYLVHLEGSIEELFSGGLIVGAFPFATYTHKTVFLRPGDLVCLFTDGVTEARNTKGDLLGDDELKALLLKNRHKPVAEIVEAIFQRTLDHAAGEPQSDDISVFMVRYVVTSAQDAETTLQPRSL
ncbi:SpoIIE family protein phosphatase [bacterium]|nr:SpoIIE family protein phosphatase [bacterium]MCI0605898.1 SpoIIE family protein phosphatase [bacterium]